MAEQLQSQVEQLKSSLKQLEESDDEIIELQSADVAQTNTIPVHIQETHDNGDTSINHATKTINNIINERLSPDDILEFERRLKIFTIKWERITWIEEYVEDWDGKLPAIEILETHLDVSIHTATSLISTYKQKEKERETDFIKLFECFEVIEHGIIWWSIILNKLQIQPQDSLFTVLHFIARELPTNACIKLLQHYKFQISNFKAIEIDRLCQSIVFGSNYPICTALRLCGYMKNIANAEVSPNDAFSKLADDYSKLSLHLLKEYTQSDHLTAMLLEMQSDIDEMSAIQLAIKYEIIDFVSDKRVHRIANSIFTTWRCLHISNKHKSFQTTLRAINESEFTDLFKQHNFYFTAFGQYVVEIISYICYLIFVTYVTGLRISIYIVLQPIEIIFWLFNLSFILHVIWKITNTGVISYWINKFDIIICINFIIMMGIRFSASISGKYSHCEQVIPYYVYGSDTDCLYYSWTNDNTYYTPCSSGITNSLLNTVYMEQCLARTCCQDAKKNMIFSMFWVITLILLYLRILHFLTINKVIGPFIHILYNVVADIASFCVILFIFALGIIMALLFVTGDFIQFENPWNTLVTIVLSGDWSVYPFEDMEMNSRNTVISIIFLYCMIIVIILFIVLFINIFTKNFDKNAILKRIQFLQVKRIYNLDSQIAVIPAPLFLFVILIFCVIKIVDGILYASKYCLSMRMNLFMPKWLINEGKETNSDGIMMSDKQNIIPAEIEYICRHCKQLTSFNHSTAVDQYPQYISSSDTMVTNDKEIARLNSQDRDPVQRLG
eukprot:272159_1